MSPGDDALAFASIAAVAEPIRSRELSCVELVDAALDRIARLDDALNACSVVLAERARAAARARDRELAAGEDRGPLHGVPVAVKDNVDVEGTATRAGSPLLARVAAADSAQAVLALERAGAVVVAKTNMYELAYGGPNPAFEPVRNPWGDGLATGGSSSGAAVAVAAGLVYAALGTDSGGSIRIPAGYCGVAALKPTLDLVPTAGILPVSPTLDHAGPLARSVDDLALTLRALAGAADAPALDGLRVGVVAAEDCAPIQLEVAEALAAAEAGLRAAGATLRTVTLPSFDAARDVKWVISGAEAAATHRDLLARAREELEPEVRRLLEEGERVTAADYRAALREREAMRAALAATFVDVDALLLTALPTTAFAADATTIEIGGRSEDALRSTTRFMSLFNVTGSPAAVVPFGLDSRGLPLSLQVAADLGEDGMALSVARALERVGGPRPRALPTPR
jgi:aspartyl-tRNA(Asn)/glutamyl-tRNA(Gln) amidotransferase subunit A